MEIPNLAPNPINIPSSPVKISIPILAIVIALSLTLGFWLSRLAPPSGSDSIVGSLGESLTSTPIAEINDGELPVAGKLYGNAEKNFKDSATGTLEKGSVNGEGTHILNREGGATQRAALTSSAVDLDLFVGKKVEIKGETNASNKAGWFMDVGTIKIIE